ncbi:hypothetical protein [Providencia phage PSTCR2]|uniref:Tail fiber protein n=1 Tax=Providencia phage PSTCR2 TaxID=2783544 RepID=A0A873WN34_9CAUD|nr:hypothetical protein [Providencia phage PSTCR2]
MAEPTGSIIRMPKVENALGQSTTNAASQKAVTDGINQAKSAASTADGKAVTAQNTATAAQTAASGAKTAADNAQKTANEAKTAAGNAQTAANNANSNANGRVPTSRKINGMDLTADRSITAAQVGAYSKSESDARYQPKGQSGGVTLGAEEKIESANKPSQEQLSLWEYGVSPPMITVSASGRGLPAGCVMTGKGLRQVGGNASNYQRYYIIYYRKITGGI